MKKIVLSVLVAGSLLATSCKKVKEEAKDLKDATVEATENAVDATKDAANKVVDGAKEGAEDLVEGAEDLVNDAKDLVSGSILEGVEIPKFSNPEVTKNLVEYANYAKEYIAAEGNVAKISQMAAKGKELLAKGKELASKLSGDELAQYNKVLAAIQSKMAPAAK